MSAKPRDSLSDWVWWIFIAIILASLCFPIRAALFPETYDKLSLLQEIGMFTMEVVGLAIFVVRPYSKERQKDKG